MVVRHNANARKRGARQNNRFDIIILPERFVLVASVPGKSPRSLGNLADLRQITDQIVDVKIV